MYKSDEDSVAIVEKAQEMTPTKWSFRKLPEIKEVVKSFTNNFTCPACGELLEKAITINGEVRGECGVTHTPIRQKVEEDN